MVMAEGKLQVVVTGTDFSSTSRGAVGEAVRLVSGRPEGRLVVVHVVSKGDVIREGLEDELRTFVLDLDVRGQLRPEQVEPRIVKGAVAEGIATVADEVGADLIVVGPLQKGFVERYLTGGPAEQLFGLTHVPVLATRGPAVSGYDYILVPVDFDEHTSRLIDLAGLMASDAYGAAGEDAHIELLHAYLLPGGVHAVSARQAVQTRLEAELTDSLRTIAAECGASSLIRTTTVVAGVASEVIPRLARSSGADLIVMGTTGGRGIGRHILGSTTSAVLGEVETPMLVVWL